VRGQARQAPAAPDLSPQVEKDFRAARQAEKLGDYESAIAAYQSVLKQRPDLAEVHHNLGLVYYMQAKNPEAIRSFQEALRRKPDLAGANLFLGMAYVRTSQYEQAIPLLRKAITQNPKESRTYLNLGLCYVETGQHLEAMKVLQKGAETFPEDVNILYNLGKVYTKLMTTTFQKMAEVDPDSFRVHQLLAESYEARREVPVALQEYQLALEREPNAPGLNYAMASLHWREGNLEEAEKGFKRELELSPEHYLATWKLGNIYLIKRDIDQALPYLLRAVEQKSDLGQAHRDLGRAYADKGDLGKAMEHFKIVAKLAPEEPTVHYRMALMHRRLGNKAEEKNEMDLFRKLKAAGDEREKRATRLERGTMLDEDSERSKKDKDVDVEPN
jgi:tetratricopeptide (TPR) repeat protein